MPKKKRSFPVVKTKLEYSKRVKRITASYDEIKDWRMDPKGYFLVRPCKRGKCIEVAHCKKLNQVDMIIKGKTAMEICHTVLKKKITENPIHLAYLAKEVQKAKIAKELGVEYVQDTELRLR